MADEEDQRSTGSEAEEDNKDRMWLRTYDFTEEQLAELKETFAMLDTSGSGVIAASHLSTAMRAMGQNPTEAEVADLLQEASLDESGSLTLDEYMKVIGGRGLKTEPEMEEELEEALRVFDKQGEGCIEAEELKQVLRTLGEPVDDGDIAEMMKVAEVAGDGKINYYDFMKKLTAK